MKQIMRISEKKVFQFNHSFHVNDSSYVFQVIISSIYNNFLNYQIIYYYENNFVVSFVDLNNLLMISIKLSDLVRLFIHNLRQFDHLLS